MIVNGCLLRSVFSAASSAVLKSQPVPNNALVFYDTNYDT